MTKVTIYNEFVHEKTEERIKEIYPNGIHGALKELLSDDDIEITTVTLDDENCGITDELLKNTDVMMWWGHMHHDKVPDEIAEKVHQAVLNGMGIIFLHSAHFSKPFKLLMGTVCSLGWREKGDYEYLWVCDPSHPIAKGLGRYVKLDHEEVYCEPFCIPEPDKLIFIGSYEGGEAFRSGCCYRRGYGKIFYFQPGHESYKSYYNKDVVTILKNAIHWAKSDYRVDSIECPNIEEIEG